MKTKAILKWLTVVFIIAISTLWADDLLAQCPMCRMSAESNLKNGGTAGKGLNFGILYMLATPYVLIGLIGFLWWKNRKPSSEEEQEMPY